MYEVKDISRIRENVEKFIGSNVILESSRGRQRTVSKKGVIESVYPSVFTVKLSEEKFNGTKVSYSYTDILTNSVSITLCD